MSGADARADGAPAAARGRTAGANGGGTPRVVAWQRLELRGFGRHAELCVAFAPGLCTLVAPNEFGKSTLVAGLAATLFGLPHVSDPTKFGRERYRSWSHPPRFEGALTLTARDGFVYELRRSFESHEVRIVRHGEDGPEEVFNGAHNPIARTGTDAYEAHLDRLIGITGREAFRESFHVAQPLPPPEALGEEVQRLLSGSGQGTFQSGLALLADMIAERTSATRDLGVSTRNQVKDRRLEALDAEIAELETKLRDGRLAADRVQELDEELADLEADRARLATDVREHQVAARACKAWLDAEDAHARQSEHHRNLRKALETAGKLAEEVAAASREIQASWPEFLDADPVALDAALAAAHEAEVELAEREAAAADTSRALADDERAEDEARAALEAHRAAEPAGSPGTRAEDLRDLQAEAGRALRDWRAYLTREDEIARRERELARFAAIDGADPQTLELLRNYRYELDRRRRDAEAERRAADDARAANVARAEAERRARRTRVTPRRLAVALLAALVVGGLVGAWTGGVLVAALAAVVAALGGFAVTPGRAADAVPSAASDAAARFHAAADAAAAGPAAGEGAYAPRGPNAGPAARAAIADPAEHAAPAQRALDAFVDATRPFVEAFGGYEDPGLAVRDRDEARRALAEERRLQEEHARRVWGVEPEDVPTADPAALDGPWGELARYAASQGSPPDRVASLAAWLERRDDEAWSREVERAAAAERARRAWQAEAAELDRRAAGAQAALQRSRKAHAAATEMLEEAQSDEAAARSAIAPLLDAAGASAGELVKRWRAYREAARARDGAAGNLAALLEGRDAATVEDLEHAEYQAGMEAIRIAGKVEALREEHPELPPLDAGREDVAERWRAHEDGGVAAARRLEEVQEAIYERTKSHSRLTAGDLVNVARAEIDLAELKREREALAAEIDALVLAHRELQTAVTDFQANYRERLERTATGYMRAFSGVEGRRVQLGPDFEVRVREPDGTQVHPGQLSQGAQDQLLLALRLAIADHLSDDAPLPLILDDPFLNWDDVRLEQVKGALQDLAAERQVILLSHRDAFADWGERAAVGRPTASG